MFRCRCRLSLILPLAVLIGAIFAIPVYAAAPRLMMIYGGTLVRPIILSDWQENGRLLAAITEEVKVISEELAQRPNFQVALFWGPEWAQYMEEGNSPRTLRPEQANQHGRFYPAFGDGDPIFRFDSIPGPGPLTRKVKPEGIEILSHYGVPVQVMSGASDTTPSQNVGIWIIGDLAVLLIVVVIATLARRRAGKLQRQ